MANQNDKGWKDTLRYFGIAGLSGLCATTVMHPVDTLKVRCQVINEEAGRIGVRHLVNPLKVAADMFKQNGIVAFYKGYDSSVLKQFTYQTARLGIYKYLYDRGIRLYGEVPFFTKLQYSIIAACSGALVGTPADMTMVRRQSDLALPPEQRRNYKHVFEAMHRIVKTEGFFALWTGLQYATVRVIAASASQLTTFEEVKERTRKWRGVKEDDIYNRAVAAAASGLVCAVTALPFDNMKVKFQKMKQNADGTFPYKSYMDVFAKTFRREGLFGFWTGFPAFYMYVAPHTLITLVAQDYFHIFFTRNTKH
jgi:solute carrier family 25 (mitochondrial oxoglutarate transporter), member 11